EDARRRDDLAAEFAALVQLPYVIEPPDVLSVTFHRKGQDVSAGQYYLSFKLPVQQLVGPDGRIDLEDLGSVYVAGLTIDEVRSTIQSRLDAKFGDVVVVVGVLKFNSKVCYVIDRRNGVDSVVRLPVSFPYSAEFTVGAALRHAEPRELPLGNAVITLIRPSVHGVAVGREYKIAWDAQRD
ncbi:MAG TPA: polysaccharide biosynthesis/export family protein, partial [Lacipirellulaceae bacterium]|nr:polysaccharide biosynthesis/export family protein [Lacipirellulaceae bacterium]